MSSISSIWDLDHQVLSYLDEFMWRERHAGDSFIAFYKHIAEQFLVPYMTIPFIMNNSTLNYYLVRDSVENTCVPNLPYHHSARLIILYWLKSR